MILMSSFQTGIFYDSVLLQISAFSWWLQEVWVLVFSRRRRIVSYRRPVCSMCAELPAPRQIAYRCRVQSWQAGTQLSKTMKSTNSSSVCCFEEGPTRSAGLRSELCPHCWEDKELISISSAGNSTFSPLPSALICTCAAAKSGEAASWRASSRVPQKLQKFGRCTVSVILKSVNSVEHEADAMNPNSSKMHKRK